MSELPPRTLLIAVVAIGIVLPGVSNYALHALGYGTVGTAVWAVGYAAMAVTVWYGWIRPMDLTGAVE